MVRTLMTNNTPVSHDKRMLSLALLTLAIGGLPGCNVLLGLVDIDTTALKQPHEVDPFAPRVCPELPPPGATSTPAEQARALQAKDEAVSCALHNALVEEFFSGAHVRVSAFELSAPEQRGERMQMTWEGSVGLDLEARRVALERLESLLETNAEQTRTIQRELILPNRRVESVPVDATTNESPLRSSTEESVTFVITRPHASTEYMLPSRKVPLETLHAFESLELGVMVSWPASSGKFRIDAREGLGVKLSMLDPRSSTTNPNHRVEITSTLDARPAARALTFPPQEPVLEHTLRLSMKLDASDLRGLERFEVSARPLLDRAPTSRELEEGASTLRACLDEANSNHDACKESASAWLGDVDETGPVDLWAARDVSARGCALGDAWGCMLQVALHAVALEPVHAQDMRRALAFRDRACDLGHEPACHPLARAVIVQGDRVLILSETGRLVSQIEVQPDINIAEIKCKPDRTHDAIWFAASDKLSVLDTHTQRFTTLVDHGDVNLWSIEDQPSSNMSLWGELDRGSEREQRLSVKLGRQPSVETICFPSQDDESYDIFDCDAVHVAQRSGALEALSALERRRSPLRVVGERVAVDDTRCEDPSMCGVSETLEGGRYALVRTREYEDEEGMRELWEVYDVEQQRFVSPEDFTQTHRRPTGHGVNTPEEFSVAPGEGFYLYQNTLYMTGIGRLTTLPAGARFCGWAP